MSDFYKLSAFTYWIFVKNSTSEKTIIMTYTVAILTITLIVLPQWLLMIFKPQSAWTQRLVDSDIIPFILLVIYLFCLVQNRECIDTSSLENLLQVFYTPQLVIGIGAYFGFISLLIGGWLFNRMQHPLVKENGKAPEQPIWV